MSDELITQRVNYVIMINNQPECKTASLKEARLFCKSQFNINEIKGVEVPIDIYKETVRLKKLQTKSSKKDVSGTSDTVFNF